MSHIKVYSRETKCNVCGKDNEPLIDLPKFPLTDIYVDELTSSDTIDQGLCVCDCGHAYLYRSIHPDIYKYSYSFRTSVGGSRKVNEKFRDFIRTFGHHFDYIVEMGCNDCFLLNLMQEDTEHLIGIDPILVGQEAKYNTDKLTVFGDFIENVDLGKYTNALYISSHLVEHLDNPKAMLEKILSSTSDNSIFVFQFPSFDYLIRDNRFDQVYNHHLQYFSLQSFTKLLTILGCEVIKYEFEPTYWGTLMIAFKKSHAQIGKGNKFTCSIVEDAYKAFQREMIRVKNYLRGCNGRKFGYGATLQVPVLNYHLGGEVDKLTYIFDDDKNKDSKYYPNMRVQIRQPSGLQDYSNAVILITAINFYRPILNKLIPLNPKKIILPFGNI